jgi:tetratricopeptide (TPR) repeat protein
VSGFRLGCRAAVLGLLLPPFCVAQAAGAGQTSAQPVNATPASRSIYLQGKVKLADGRSLPDRVAIERVCNGIVYREGDADSRGDFGLQVGSLNPSTFLDASVGFDKVPALGVQGSGSQTGLSERSLAGCEIRANVPGYLSDSITLGFRRALDNPYIGVIYLHPLARVEGYTSSATTAQAPKKAAEAYEKALKSMKKQEWGEAERELMNAVRDYPKYAIAWFELGRLFQQQDKLEDAGRAFREAINADAKFAGPYRQLAAITALGGAWEDVARYTSQLFRLDSDAGPEFYFYSAVANHYLRNSGVALQHARQAARLDAQHRNPKINHVLGVILAQMGDYREAAENLRIYLRLAPSAPDAAGVRAQLADLEKAL